MKSYLHSSIMIFMMAMAVLLSPNAEVCAEIVESDFEIENALYIYATKLTKNVAVRQIPEKQTLNADEPSEFFQIKVPTTNDSSPIKSNLQNLYCVLRE